MRARGRAVQCGGVCLPSAVVQAVVERAVDDGVELSIVAGQFGDVGDVEARLDTGLGSTGTGLLDRRRRAVEARHRVAATSQVDHVVAEAATSVEHLSADRAERFEFHKPRLRLSDVPRDGFGGGRARECGLSA